MEKIFFKYKVHPGDFLRNADIVELPNPDNNLGDFLVWFLKNYQSDNRITYLDDLYKLLNDEFFDENDKLNFIEQIGNKSGIEITDEINLLEERLKNIAFKNFYYLLLDNKISIVNSNEK